MKLNVEDYEVALSLFIVSAATTMTCAASPQNMHAKLGLNKILHLIHAAHMRHVTFHGGPEETCEIAFQSEFRD